MQKDSNGENYIQIRLTNVAAKFLQELTKDNIGISLAITLEGETLARAVIRNEIRCGSIGTHSMSVQEACNFLRKIGKSKRVCDIIYKEPNNTVTDYNLESVWITSIECQHRQDGCVLLIQLADHFQRIMNRLRSDAPDCMIRFMFLHRKLAVMSMSEITIARGMIRTEPLPEPLAKSICRELTHPGWRVRSPKQAKSQSSANTGLVRRINFSR